MHRPMGWTKEEDQLWDAAGDGKDGEIERLIDAGTRVDCAHPASSAGLKMSLVESFPRLLPYAAQQAASASSSSCKRARCAGSKAKPPRSKSATIAFTKCD